MQDHGKEEAFDKQSVEKAEAKIAKWEAHAAAMSPDDPLYHDALVTLHEMRHNGATADLLRSLTLSDKSGDWSCLKC